MNDAFHVLVVLFAAYMLWNHGRRALLFVAPGLVRLHSRAGEGPRSTPQLRAEEELAGLGFVRLGARRERGPLGGLDFASECYVNEREGAWADVFDHAPRGGGGPMAYFLSPFPRGAMVLTANHPRLAVSTADVQAGGLPGAAIAATWSAHRVAVARFRERHGAPEAPASLAARDAAARRWYAGAGRRELRRLFVMNFVNTLVALVLLAGSVNALARHIMA